MQRSGTVIVSGPSILAKHANGASGIKSCPAFPWHAASRYWNTPETGILHHDRCQSFGRENSKQTHYYSRKARDLSPIFVGETVAHWGKVVDCWNMYWIPTELFAIRVGKREYWARSTTLHVSKIPSLNFVDQQGPEGPQPGLHCMYHMNDTCVRPTSMYVVVIREGRCNERCSISIIACVCSLYNTHAWGVTWGHRLIWLDRSGAPDSRAWTKGSSMTQYQTNELDNSYIDARMVQAIVYIIFYAQHFNNYRSSLSMLYLNGRINLVPCLALLKVLFWMFGS